MNFMAAMRRQPLASCPECSDRLEGRSWPARLSRPRWRSRLPRAARQGPASGWAGSVWRSLSRLSADGLGDAGRVPRAGRGGSKAKFVCRAWPAKAPTQRTPDTAEPRGIGRMAHTRLAGGAGSAEGQPGSPARPRACHGPRTLQMRCPHPGILSRQRCAPTAAPRRATRAVRSKQPAGVVRCCEQPPSGMFKRARAGAQGQRSMNADWSCPGLALLRPAVARRCEQAGTGRAPWRARARPHALRPKRATPHPKLRTGATARRAWHRPQGPGSRSELCKPADSELADRVRADSE